MVAKALAKSLKLVSPGRKTPALDLLEAVVDQPTLTRTIDGASTVAITVADYDRKLLRSGLIDERCWVVVEGVHFELVGVSKSADKPTLTFEDAIAASLRRVTSRRVIPGGTMTRAQIVHALAKEPRSNVPVDVDDDKRGPVQAAIKRSVGEKGNTWDVLYDQVAEPVRWRRFSTGTRLMVGADEWLLARKAPLALREGMPGVVSSIDFELDVAKRVSEASLTVDTTLFGIAPGDPARLTDMGPADGQWLIAEVSRAITGTRASLRLVRPKHSLKEPKKQREPGDSGDPDYVPGQGGTDTNVPAGSTARTRMVAFALAQAGDTYVYGANGPDAWDCSGLVQAATGAAGKGLAKPVSNQWATCLRVGCTVPVAVGLATRGALLFRLGGEYNHVAISLGNGTTMEARGTGYGVGVFGNAAGGGWTGAALWI